MRGHEILADLLLSYLEMAACELAAEYSQVTSLPMRAEDDAAIINVTPPRPSIDRLGVSSPSHKRDGECIQVANLRLKQKVKKNKGWARLATSRDKQ